MADRPLKFDAIGYWSEVKLDILREYASAYSTILSKQRRLSHVYIDGFAGAGVHVQKLTGEFVAGSPLNALLLEPPFDEYYLIDLDGDKVSQLRGLADVRSREHVHVLEGDCNEVLREQVFPNVQYGQYRRGLCVLDPYGLHLDWGVLAQAGRMRTLDLFLNFPIMDMNRNALWREPDRVSDAAIGRMTSFWGDVTWRDVAYRKQRDLFGNLDEEKRKNEAVVEAFRQRLKDVAGFQHVPEPMPMRNHSNAVVYYLFFASHKPVAEKIVQDIFRKYR